MKQKTQTVLCDQFGQPVEVGKLYGVRSRTEPPSRGTIARCLYIIRDRVWFQNQHGWRWDVKNCNAAEYVATLLDESGREMVDTPREVLERRCEALREHLTMISARARSKRAAQRRLIDEVVELWGCVEHGPNLLDAVATFIRDDDSHVTVDELVAEYRAAVLGDD